MSLTLYLLQVIVLKIDTFGLSHREVRNFREGLGIETNMVLMISKHNINLL